MELLEIRSGGRAGTRRRYESWKKVGETAWKKAGMGLLELRWDEKAGTGRRYGI